jgi:2-oxo-4-hydroxy-4-carboxy-5-ureidoimidazoline decarboxylase
MQNTSANPSFTELPSQMDEETFVARFGAVYEHSPWVATAAWRTGVTTACDSVAGLAHALATTLSTASEEKKLALICAHPDLAGRTAVGGELTDESTNEQTSAGLDKCTQSEFDKFQRLNDAYTQKFGFPFVMAVRGANRHDILTAFQRRLEHSVPIEFERALGEIDKIARLRIETIIEPGPAQP